MAGLVKSSEDPAAQIPFKLHDFGARGVSSRESATIGGMAHLVNFLGTDTISALMGAQRYYDEPMAGFSIPASEHSTMTCLGREGEVDQMRRMLEFAMRSRRPDGSLVYPIFACVSDSYDLFHAITDYWGGELKPMVLQYANMGGKVVMRPDSGVPHEIVPKVIGSLMERFGSTRNALGYDCLPPYIGVIQGDGVTYETIPGIIEACLNHQMSIDNIAFGMGGGLLQMVNRDMLKFAMKCSAIRINGVWREVYKDPITDSGKASKRGRLALITDSGRWETVPDEGNAWRTHLGLVYKDGTITRRNRFAEIRQTANTPMLGEAT
jgi:nicotinamide phosphoribosyltransferase